MVTVGVVIHVHIVRVSVVIVAAEVGAETDASGGGGGCRSGGGGALTRPAALDVGVEFVRAGADERAVGARDGRERSISERRRAKAACERKRMRRSSEGGQRPTGEASRRSSGGVGNGRRLEIGDGSVLARVIVVRFSRRSSSLFGQ